MNTKRPEILAPVGGEEQLLAAVRCGADAVYFGLPDFNARRSAQNFAAEGLADTVRYCHAYGVKVYITINILVKDSETAAMEKAVDTAALAGADGIIVQDLAVARYARAFWPDLAVHASTQCAAHNSEGVLQLLEYGFKRVVLARELSLEEIRTIYEKTGAELEVFVHGAHCMSVSGNCYISSMIGCRSGNRGMCAQPCRLDWQLDGADHVLSLKDMSYLDSFAELSAAGAASFKIEGRMKRPEYVAAAVTACRAALEGREYDRDTLRAVFSRSGFTDGYLSGKRDASMFGFRTKEDVVSAPAVLKDLQHLYEKDPQLLPVDMLLYVQQGDNSQLTASCGDVSVTVLGDEPQIARNLPIDEAYARRSLSKTGGTPYYLNELTLAAGQGLMLPSSQLNELRRRALEALTGERTAVSRKKQAAVLQPQKGHAIRSKRLRLRFERPDQIFSGAAELAEAVILPLAEVVKHPALADRLEGRLWAELPALIWEGEIDSVKKQLRELKSLGVYHAVAENIGAVRLARGAGLTVHGGAFLNVLNSAAADEYFGLGVQDMTLSFENSFECMRKFKTQIPFGFIAYGKIPVMKFRACPGQNAGGCGGCGGTRALTDRMGEEFTMLCRGRGYQELLNCVPIYTADKPRPASDFETLYFTTESRDDCELITDMHRAQASPDFRRTMGLYNKQLL